MSTSVRSSKLKFKGDKSSKKRKREHGSTSRGKEDEASPDTWVLPEFASELRGPAFVFHPSDPHPYCMQYDSTRNRLALQQLDKDVDPSAAPSILDRVPTEVSQVWVITRIAGSSTVNLRTGIGEGKFLSCDKHGLVSADRDARGPQEEWTPVVLPDGMTAFMSVHEKYLSVDEVAGGTLSLRGDSENIGFGERFWVKVQSKYKREANDEEKKKKEGISNDTIDEIGTNHMHQAWGAGRSVVSKDDTRELKRAKKDGRLAEAMLERRAKLKSDRFC